MIPDLAAFRAGFIRTSIEFLFFGGILLVRLFCPRLYFRFLEWDCSLSRRLGLPANWVARCRRFSEGKGFIVMLSIFVLLFFLLMCFNLGAYYHFRDMLYSEPPNQALQATAAAPGIVTFAFSHSTVVADASALPAAVPGMC